MLENWEFRPGTHIRFGWGVGSKVGQTASAWGRRIFWVGYRDLAGLETVYQKVLQGLKAADLVVEKFWEVSGEPDMSLVQQGAEAARSFGAEVVLGVGGGSVLDVAKAVAALAKLGGLVEQYLPIHPHPRGIDQALPILAVPTTAGTGSEVTSLAVLHGRSAEEAAVPMKLTLAAEPLTPKVALVDPEHTITCGPRLTALCAADALSHAIEASMSRRTTPLTRLLAEEAIVRIFSFLLRALDQPTDRQARESLCLAATLAGLALQHSGATLGHAMAHALGALAGMPHGEAVARATPVALRFNMPECTSLLAGWAKRLGLPGQTPQDQAEAFIAGVVRLFGDTGLLASPNSLPAILGSDSPNLLSQNAFQSTPVPLKWNPRKIDRAILQGLFQELLEAK